MPRPIRNILVTGPAGQLGRALVSALVAEGYHVRALVHKTPVNLPNVQSVHGDVSNLNSVRRAMKNIDAVCQLATTKEDPATFIDVSVRGTYNLLEAARETGRVQRWILAGGDAAMGIYYYPNPKPLTETMPHRAYPGVYALSKVLEEVLGQQFFIQHNLPYICLRCSWILHSDMILRHLSAKNHLARVKGDPIAMLLNSQGNPLKRHVVALPDVVHAFLLALKKPAKKIIGQTFNISGPAPFKYDRAANYLARRTNRTILPIHKPEAHDFEIDISKARRILNYNPTGTIEKIIDAALACPPT